MRIDAIKDKIIAVIDEGMPFKLLRAPYDEEFAVAHGITLNDIQKTRYVPCLECGVDIAPMLLLGKFSGGKANVFCSPECRRKHAFIRFRKIDGTTSVNALAQELIAKGLDIELERPRERHMTPKKLDILGAALETNALLREILKELRDGNRRTGASLSVLERQGNH